MKADYAQGHADRLEPDPQRRQVHPAGGRLIDPHDATRASISAAAIVGTTAFSHRLAVEFEDTGFGIDAKQLLRIFEPFEQGVDELRGRSSGLGLGLAISRSLAEAMGGALTASSPGPGRGSTFRLELPAVSTLNHAATISDGAVTPPRLPKTASDAPLRILLVEDNHDTLRFLATVLRDRGHEVVTADCLAAAREVLMPSCSVLDEVEVHFDLLISDIELPDGNGLELMREISINGAIPGIAMSGFGGEEDLELSREAGFVDHLTKPLDLHRLEAAIRRVLDQVDQFDPGEAFGSRTRGSGSGAFKLV